MIKKLLACFLVVCPLFASAQYGITGNSFLNGANDGISGSYALSSHVGAEGNFRLEFNAAPPGAALAFDGVDDRLVSNSLTLTDFGTTSFTVEGWFNTTGSGMTLFSNRSSNGKFFTVSIGAGGDAGQLHVELDGSAGNYNLFKSSSTYNDGNWHHVAISRLGVNTAIYADGALIGTLTNSTVCDVSGADGFFVGFRYIGGIPNGLFNGAIDNVRGWTRALGAAEINANYLCENPANTSGLLFQYTFNQGFGGADNTGLTAITDASGNANNATLSNFDLTGITSNFIDAGGVVSGSNCLPLSSVPTIASFSPTTGPVGTSITITGTNFNTTPANNIVYFGATKATVTVATTIQLTVTVPAGATYAPITVLNTAAGLLAYSNGNFTPTFSPPKGSITTADFIPKVDFAAGSTPNWVATGDLNNDGKADLAVVNLASSTVSVYTNASSSGTISYNPKIDLSTGGTNDPIAVAIGDLDGDGKPDLAVVSNISNTLSIFRNTSANGGAVTFDSRADFSTGANPHSVAVGDLDGDGKAEVAVANYGPSTVSVFVNNSSVGSISYAPKLDFTTGLNPETVAIGDLDGDGKSDLAVSNFNSNTISVFRNLSSGGTTSFAAKVDFATGASPVGMVLGDLDGDGKADLAVANNGGTSISVLRNTSTSTITFATKVDFSAGSGSGAIAIADLDGDAKPDLAVGNFLNDNTSVFRNTGSIGTINFASKIDFPTNSGPNRVAIGDADGDGRPDLIVANQGSANFSVIRNNPVSAPINTFDVLGLTNANPAVNGYSVRRLSTTYTGPLVRVSISGAYFDVYPDATSKQIALTSPVSASYPNYNDPGTGPTGNTFGNVLAGFTSNVAIWYDQSGNGRDVLQSNSSLRPTIATSGVINLKNGMPAVYFNNKKLESAPFNNAYNGAFTLALVAGVKNDTGLSTFVNKSSGNIASPFDIYNANFWFGSLTGTDAAPLSQGLYASQGFSQWTFTADNSVATAYKNGIGNGSLGTNIAKPVLDTPSTPLVFGSREDGATSLDGWISEFVSFNSVLNSTNRGKVENSQLKFIRASPKPGKAIALNGTSDFVNVQDANSLDLTNQLTFEAWVNPTNAANGDLQVILGKARDGSGNSGYNIGLTASGTVGIGLNDGLGNNTGAISTAKIPSGVWTHVAATYDGATMKVYINGLLDGTNTFTLSLQNSSEALNIGRESAGLGRYFGGKIDEVRIWNVARTQAQIAFNAGVELLGNEPGLVGLWHFNELAGTTAFDDTFNANNGTLSGAGYVPSQAMSPIITSISPATGVVGSTVTLNGIAFDDVSATNNVVSFTNLVPATVTAFSRTAVTATVPVGASTGPVSLTVAGMAGTAISPTVFTVIPLSPTPPGNNGLYFEGADYAQGNSAFAYTKNFTLSAWVKMSQKPAPGEIGYVALNGTSGNGYGLVVDEDGRVNVMLSGLGLLDFDKILEENKWTHLAINRDNNGFWNLFINGVADLQTGNYNGTPVAATNYFTIGNNIDYTSGFVGQIDEVRFYDYVQTPAQITASMASATAGDAIVYFPLNETTGLVANNTTAFALTLGLGATDGSNPLWAIRVTNTNATGAGSFSDAIAIANTEIGANYIDFSIQQTDPTSVSVINPTSSTNVLQPVFIDGYSAYGSSPNTAPFLSTNDAKLRVELNFGSIPTPQHGLLVSTQNSTIQGLSLFGIGSGAGSRYNIALNSTSDSFIQGNFIGLKADGTGGGGMNGIGIDLNSNGNTIGGSAPSDMNIVSNQLFDGFQINGVSNIIQGNYIGTGLSGNAGVGNSARGISLNASDNELLGNLIGANSLSGILIQLGANGSIVKGNYIGIKADLSGALANGGDGIRIENTGASDTDIGGTIAGEANTIAYNGNYGVSINGGGLSINNKISGNQLYGNAAGGIFLSGAGTNNNKTVPTVVSASIAIVTGTSGPSDVVEIFKDSPQTGGTNQGRVYLGTVTASGGAWSFSDASLASLITGDRITATATAGNNTSTFSTAAVVAPLVVGTTPASTTGLYFNGVDSKIVANPVSLSDFTVEFWVKTKQQGKASAGSNWYNGYGLVDADQSGFGDDFGVSLASGKIVFGLGNLSGNESSMTSNAVVNDGAWHHVAAVRNGTNISIYIDGIQDNTSTSVITGTVGVANLTMGASANPLAPNSFFNGQLDEVKVFKVVRSQADILLDMNSKAANGAVVYYDFDDDLVAGNQTVAANIGSIGNSLDATFAGSPLWATRVTNINNAGAGSLRAALLQADNDTDLDYIDFSIQQSNASTVSTIVLTSPFNNITNPLFIDGYSAYGSITNTAPLASGNNAAIRVEVDGQAVNSIFSFQGAGTTLRGLSLYGLNSPIQTMVEAYLNNLTISGNYIGLKADGLATVANNGEGINIAGGSNATIIGNVIANQSNGLRIFSSSATITGNLFGVTSSGWTRVSNNVGIEDQGSGNTIQGNVIASTTYGINLRGTNAIVKGNFIGTDPSGAINLGTTAANGAGVNIMLNQSSSGGGTDNVIGGTTLGEGNAIAYNSFYGVRVFAARINNKISGNKMYANTVTGISLAGAGANNNKTAPTILSTNTSTISGTTTGATDAIEIFNDTPQAGGGDQGRTYLGTVTAASGSWSFPGSFTLSDRITATATDVNNNTSAFSAAAIVCPVISLLITNPAAVCSPGTVDLTAGAVTAGSTGGLTYTYWTNLAATASLASPAAVAASGTYYIKGTALPGCFDVQAVTVTINALPTPVISGLSAVCATATGVTYSTPNVGGNTYSWTVSGGTIASGAGTNSITVDWAAAGSGTVQLTETISATGCAVTTSPYSVTINVIPALSSGLTPAAICSGAIFSYTPTSTTLGSSFSWSRLTTSGIIQPSNSGSGIINETLTNTKTGPISVTYQVVTLANGCANAVQNVIVSVNPTPQFTITNSEPAVCSNSNSTPTSITLNTPTSGGVITPLSTFAYPSGISGGTLTPSITFNNGDVIAETLTNSTNSPITVTYTFSVNAGTCANTSTRFTSVVVNPNPKLAVLTPPPVCQGNTVDITQSGYIDATNSTSGLVYSYYDGTNTTLLLTPSSMSNSGTYFIRGTVPLTGCAVSSPIVVTINPLPIAQVAPVNTTVCSGDPILINVTSTESVTYVWSRPTVIGILEASSQNRNVAVSERLTSTTANPIQVSYDFVISNSNGCQIIRNAALTLNPLPIGDVQNTSVLSGAPIGITFRSSSRGAVATSYILSTIANGGLTPSSGNATVSVNPRQNPIQSNRIVNDSWINTTFNSVEVKYSLIPVTALGCEGSEFTVTSSILPNVFDPQNLTVTITSADGNAQIGAPALDNNGIETEPIFNSESVGKVIFGASFRAGSTGSSFGVPKLNSFVIDLGPVSEIKDVLNNPRIYQSVDNKFDVTDVWLSDIKLNNEGNNYQVILPQPFDLSERAVTYFLRADISPLVSQATNPISPSLSSGKVVLSIGSVANALIQGRNYSFRDISAPVINKLTPGNNSKNFLRSSDIVIEFNEPVTYLGGDISVFTLDDQLVGRLTASASQPVGASRIYTYPAAALNLKEITDYYILIPKGNVDNNQGFVDLSGNVFNGIPQSRGWRFTTIDPVAPKFVFTDETDFAHPNLTTNYSDVTLSGINIETALNKVGRVNYLITPSPSVKPTLDQLFNPSTYGGSVTVADFIYVNQDSVAQYGSANPLAVLIKGQLYDVWLAGENLSGVRMEEKDIQQLTFLASDPDVGPYDPLITSAIRLTNLCVGDYQNLSFPISISERQSKNFAVGENQTFNLLLPKGFEFNPLAPRDTVIGRGADLQIKSFSYSGSLLRIEFSVKSANSRDRIIISGLQIKALSETASGAIVRLGGNGLEAIGDLKPLATLGVTSIPKVDFDLVDLSTGTKFEGVISSAQEKVNLKGKFDLRNPGENTFSGTGVFGDEFFTDVAGLGESELTLTHANQFGCISVNVKRITVYDKAKAINGLDIVYNTNQWPAAKITRNGKGANYLLDELRIVMPAAAQNPYSVNVGNSFKKEKDGSFTFDPRFIVLDQSKVDNARTQTGDKLFFPEGGKLVDLVFEGKYLNLTTGLQDVFVQTVQLYYPPKPSITGLQPVYCEDIGLVSLAGFPQPRDGVSTGFFRINGQTSFFTLADELNGKGAIDVSRIATSKTLGYKEYSVSYVYKILATGGTDTTTQIIKVAPKPVVTLTTSMACVTQPVNFAGKATIDASDKIAYYDWDYDDDQAPLSERRLIKTLVDNPAHTFKVARTYNVTFTATSLSGCKSLPAKQASVKVGDIPTVNFSISGVSLKDPVKFSSSSFTINDAIASESWDFGDVLSSTNNGLGRETAHTYSKEGIYTAKLSVTGVIGCVNSKTIKLAVIKDVEIATSNYSEDFEGSTGGWLVFDPTKSSWNRLKSTIGGNKNPSFVWKTDSIGNGNSTYKTKEVSYLYSPAFDFIGLKRPMISFKSFVNFESEDGVVLEYSTDDKNISDNNKKWLTLGKYSPTTPSGINWYTAEALLSRPGKQQANDYGWSSQGKSIWQESRHSLAEVDSATRKKVVFRFALASVNKPVAKGFAFDDIKIGSRTRTVLLENFVNSGNAEASEKQQSDFIKDKLIKAGIDVAKINYHTSFPGSDPFNLANASDQGARALFYDVTKTPVMRLDGLNRAADKNKESPFSNWSNQLNLRALELAKADVQIAAVTDKDGSIRVSATITARDTILDANSIVHIAILERSIALAQLSAVNKAMIKSGEVDFEYVLKKMLPTAAGTKLTKALLVGQSEKIGPYEWLADPALLYLPKDDLAVVVFIQHGGTKEVHQAALVLNVKDPEPITGLEDVSESEVTVFPNPSDREVTIQLPRVTLNRVNIELRDQMGRLVMTDFIGEGKFSSTINTQDLPSGLYFVKLGSNDQSIIKKALIIHE